MRRPLDILYNFHWVAPGEAARSAQAHFGFLAPFLKRHGFRALINLRGENPDFGWWRSERQACAAAGAAHVDAMLDSRKLPTHAMLCALFSAFDSVPKPFLVKCSGGQDRTSLAAALYILHRDGWGAMTRAERQFSRWPYLHFPKKHQRWLRQFIAYAHERAGARPIAQWIGDSYNPDDFAQWLKDRGLGDSFARVFDKPEASPWQW